VEVTSPRILADKNSNLKANSTKQIVASGTNSPVFFTGKKKQASSSGSPDQNLLGSNEIKDSKNSPY